MNENGAILIQRNKEFGFTLLELAVVIVIIILFILVLIYMQQG
ncbi:hypothetical protein EOL73_01480 [Candidatus Saccharibacteria bacterium]|nr:hypothetical protein [Candidatus Saccharibacteria bacterium]NCU40407.1 hypothetical protein [Candidatus Saccharibacteria bacterium]